MKKRFVSLILTGFLILSIFPFAAFADDALVCPACGGHVTKQALRLLFNSTEFFKCDSCGKWAYLVNPGLKLFSVGDQAILDAADANALLTFVFSNGKLIPASEWQAGGGSASPGGVGRHPAGYESDEGVPSVGSDGVLYVRAVPVGVQWSAFNSDKSGFYSEIKNSSLFESGTSSSGAATPSVDIRYVYEFTAPVTGLYYIGSTTWWNIGTVSYFYSNVWKTNRSDPSYYSNSDKYFRSVSLNKGEHCYLYAKSWGVNSVTGIPYKWSFESSPNYIACEPLGDTVNKQTNITINNNTWNGNIYVDSSTNLTYIYPQYTTINENNETITEISKTAIIYNQETKKYYTYDEETKTYYEINFSSPTPTPDPTPSPTPDPDNPDTPTPTPTPGGNTGGGSSGGSSDSGSSWWEKLLDKLGSAIIDGLLGAIEGILKLLFDLFSSIFGWVIWLASQVLTLFPFLPPGVGPLIVGGVVVCFILAFIKFIRG